MEYPWTNSSDLAHCDKDLNLLDGDNLLLELDDKTLQCLVGGAPLPPATASDDTGGPEPSGSGKRRRAHENFTAWLADFTKDDDEHANETSPSDNDGSAPAGKVGKRGRPMSEAALAKATRERARRERLNEYFEELARLCDPSGKSIKADRVSVVADAIRVVQQLRVENNQLKQLNKFLEERTGALERNRAQTMFQNAAAAAAAAQNLPSTSAGGGALPHLPLMQQQQHIQTQPQQQVQMVMLNNTQNVAIPAGGVVNTAGGSDQHVLVQVPIGSTLGTQLMAIKQEHIVQANGAAMNASGGPAGADNSAVVQHEMPPGAPAVGWLPAPDLTQDQKLRPPAA